MGEHPHPKAREKGKKKTKKKKEKKREEREREKKGMQGLLQQYRPPRGRWGFPLPWHPVRADCFWGTHISSITLIAVEVYLCPTADREGLKKTPSIPSAIPLVVRACRRLSAHDADRFLLPDRSLPG